MNERGVLRDGEPHPIAKDALIWIRENYSIPELYVQLEAFSSCAIEGNRLAEVCASTLRRLLNKEPVSDRYLLGLAWYLRMQKENDNIFSLTQS